MRNLEAEPVRSPRPEMARSLADALQPSVPDREDRVAAVTRSEADGGVEGRSARDSRQVLQSLLRQSYGAGCGDPRHLQRLTRPVGPALSANPGGHPGWTAPRR